MYRRSRDNFVMTVEIVQKQRSDYFSKTEHENRSSMIHSIWMNFS